MEAMALRLAIALWSICLVAPLVALSAGDRADGILVNKARHEMLLLKNGKILKTYQVALGKHPVGPKIQEGDMRTPEGIYRIDGRYAKSQFHMALHISYPNASDRERAQALGIKAGSDILIHGLPNGQGSVGKGHLQSDWTWGCIAVTDEEIEEIWKMVPTGTVVEIRP